MKIEVDVLQEYLTERYGGWAKDSALFMKLVEEVGEVAEVLNMRSGSKAKESGDLEARLGEELSDIIHYVVAIAAVNNINLSRAIIEKDKLGSKKYNHDINLERFIQAKEESGGK